MDWLRFCTLGTSCGPPAESATPLESAITFARAAKKSERRGCADAVDLHYQSLCHSWQVLGECAHSSCEWRQAWQIYHSSLEQLILLARDQGRFIPGHGLLVYVHGHPVTVRLAMHGFAWHPPDVQQLFPVGHYQTGALTRQHQQRGWGVPLVVRRCQRTGCYAEEPFLTRDAMFAATALLRPAADCGPPVLELFNPLATKVIPISGHWEAMAADISAPFALRVFLNPQVANGWLPFVDPSDTVDEGLHLLEPYQPGKIPVVLVHGLLSSPTTWVDLGNDLRAEPGFTDRFQLWVFRYSTGRPFLHAAARLRRDLYNVTAAIDPDGQDPDLRQMVLIGHSMGGLVCKLQATASQDYLWRTIANRPLDQIVASDHARAELAELCYFVPQPHVRRIIFLATPHRGAYLADRPIGRLATMFVRPDPELAQRNLRLVTENPGVFAPEVQDHIPTSIDMLEPESPLLAAIYCLPTSPCVTFHTIMGNWRTSRREGPGDGIVSIESATYPASASQIVVCAKHTEVHRTLDSVNEITRILNLHYAECEEADSSIAPLEALPPPIEQLERMPSGVLRN